MTEQIQNYLADLENVEDKWDTYVVRPYGNAYEAAYTRFQATVDAQKAQDQLVAELVMVGLTLASGSLLTVVAGSALMKTAIVKGAVELVCARNMTRTFDMMAMVASSKAASFALGAAWDEGAKRFSSAIEDQVKAGIGTSGRVTPGTLATPRAVENRLMNFVAELKIFAHDAAADMRDNPRIPATEKNAAVAAMRRAHFFKVPKALDESEAARRIELGFYLTLVMNTDYTRVVRAYQTVSPMGSGLSQLRERPVPVTAAPFDPSYPRAVMSGRAQDVPRQGAALAWREGFFESVGNKVQARINQLTGTQFFASRLIFSEPTKLEHLQRAERALNELGERSRAVMKIAA